MSAREVHGWAAQWDQEHGPLIHTVRRTRRDVIEYFADAWGAKSGLTAKQAWAKAYRRGLRIVRVSVRTLGERDG